MGRESNLGSRDPGDLEKADFGKREERRIEMDEGDRDEHHIEIDETDAQSRAAATGAAVAHVLGRPDTIRQRAQNAATISSAVAAALVIAAVAQLAKDNTETWEPWTVALVVMALGAWVLSVVMFLRVVTHGVRDEEKQENKLWKSLKRALRRGRSTDSNSATGLHGGSISDGQKPSYQELINCYENHSHRLRFRLRRAAWASLGALTLTVAAIAAEVGEEYHSPKHTRQLVLTQSGASAVARVCGWTSAIVPGDTRIIVKVATRELSNQMVLVSVLSRPGRRRESECNARTDRIRLPRSAILASSDLER
jgi:hypothetical protein